MPCPARLLVVLWTPLLLAVPIRVAAQGERLRILPSCFAAKRKLLEADPLRHPAGRMPGLGARDQGPRAAVDRQHESQGCGGEGRRGLTGGRARLSFRRETKLDPAQTTAANAETGAAVTLGADGFTVPLPQRDFVPVLLVRKGAE